MIKAIIFDLDGTLCDTMEDLKEAMNAMLRSFGWAERSREELLRFINRGARNFVADSMPEGSYSSIDDESVTRALRKYNDCYAECCGKATRPYDGMAKALSELKKTYRLGVLSNKQEPFVKKIIADIFPGVFDSVHGQVEGIPTKPDPLSLERAISELGVLPGECAFIGDSDVDMKTGRNALMHPVGVTWGYRSREVLEAAGAEAICSSPAEIFGIIESL